MNKLELVLEYIISNNPADRAKADALMHDIIIEKAKRIHEELIASEDDDFIDGDEGDHLVHGIKDPSDDIDGWDDDIDSEEIYEGEDVVDIDDAIEDIGDDEDEIGNEIDGDDDDDDIDPDLNDAFEDFQSAYDELKDAFDRIENNKESDSGKDLDTRSEDDAGMSDRDVVDEDDDWEDLDESIDMDVVTDSFYSRDHKDDKFVGDAGAYKSASTKSPVPKSQGERFGAKPVDFDKGNDVDGFDWKVDYGYNPKSEKTQIRTQTGRDSNQRKSAMDGNEKMVTGDYGKVRDMDAELQTDKGFKIEDKPMSPFSKVKVNESRRRK